MDKNQGEIVRCHNLLPFNVLKGMGVVPADMLYAHQFKEE